MKKYIWAAVAVLVLAGGYFSFKMFASKPSQRPRKKQEQKALTVFSQTVENTTLPIIVKGTGTLMAKNRIELFAEVQGMFKSSAKTFKPGIYYPKGAVLLNLESEDQQASLRAQKSSLYNLIATSLPDLKIDFPEAFPHWEEYANAFDVDKPLTKLPTPVSNKEKVFISSKNIYTTYYNIASVELRLDKYIIRAPFSGTLTEASVTKGTLIRPGQKLGEFISSGVYEMEVAVGVSFMPFMKAGEPVKVRSLTGVPKTWEGRVIRINDRVDRASQTATVYIQVEGKDLAEGMYLEAIIEAKEEEGVFELDRTLLVDEKYVYTIQDSLLTSKEIRPVYFKQKTVIVRGLENGDKILAKSIPSAYEGLKVEIYEE